MKVKVSSKPTNLIFKNWVEKLKG